jgi:hypothetical protein
MAVELHAGGACRRPTLPSLVELLEERPAIYGGEFEGDGCFVEVRLGVGPLVKQVDLVLTLVRMVRLAGTFG